MGFHGDISVTYSGGVLKPDRRLNLPEGARLRARLRSIEIDSAAAERAVEEIRRIRESGAFRSGGRRFTRDEVHERH
jgi:predicted DNA-binding antitoxin AbrB/MazE fold protein